MPQGKKQFCDIEPAVLDLLQGAKMFVNEILCPCNRGIYNRNLLRRDTFNSPALYDQLHCTADWNSTAKSISHMTDFERLFVEVNIESLRYLNELMKTLFQLRSIFIKVFKVFSHSFQVSEMTIFIICIQPYFFVPVWSYWINHDVVFSYMFVTPSLRSRIIFPWWSTVVWINHLPFPYTFLKLFTSIIQSEFVLCG